jgi:pSer/pThr/pTyr-binding forkhead associated (FHA) protein
MADVKVPLTFQVVKGGQILRTEKFTQEEVRIGRLGSTHLKLDEEGVSRVHATVTVLAADQIVITDLGSQRGTFVNGQRVQKANLRSGDVIKIGEFELRLTVGQPISTAVAAPVSAAAVTSAPRQPARQRPVLPPMDLSKVEVANTITAEAGLWFGGVARQVLHLTPMRRVWVGDEEGCAFYASQEDLGLKKFPLVWVAQEPVPGSKVEASEFLFCFPAKAKGEVSFDEVGKGTPLSDLVQSGQAQPVSGMAGVYGVKISRTARCTLRINDSVSLVVNAVAKPRSPKKAGELDWPLFAYVGGTATVAALFLALIFQIPDDSRYLTLNQSESDNQYVKFSVKPPEQKEEKVPSWLKSDKKEEQGGKGKKHAGDEGKMGKKNSPNKTGLYQIKGPPNNSDPHLARQKAQEAALNSSVLSVLKGGGSAGSPFASVFGRDDAVGSDPENVLGGLYGDRPGEAEGGYGLGLTGTGIGGGGTGEGTIGLGSDNTIGKGGGGGSGSGYGRGAGNIGGRTAGAPEVLEGKADVKGSLDKEIIRRVIRRAMPGIKF